MDRFHAISETPTKTRRSNPRCYLPPAVSTETFTFDSNGENTRIKLSRSGLAMVVSSSFTDAKVSRRNRTYASFKFPTTLNYGIRRNEFYVTLRLTCLVQNETIQLTFTDLRILK